MYMNLAKSWRQDSSNLLLGIYTESSKYLLTRLRFTISIKITIKVEIDAFLILS